MAGPARIEELRAEARYRRGRYELYRAKMYGLRATSMARLSVPCPPRVCARTQGPRSARRSTGLQRSPTAGSPEASRPCIRRLRALAECPGDGFGGRAHAELGLQAREPLPHRVKAEEQLPSDLRLVLQRGRRP